MLSQSLFGVKNPHSLQLGAHNEANDEYTGGLISDDHLPLNYKALDFRQPDPSANNSNCNFALLEEMSGETSANFGSVASSSNESFNVDN